MRADRGDRKRGRARMRVIEELRKEFELVTTTATRINGTDTPALVALAWHARVQKNARWIYFRGVFFPVRRGDDWARTILDPVTREPLLSTNGGWLV